MSHPKYAPHPAEARTRASIAAVLSVTGEPNVAIAELLMVRDAMIGRRQRGQAPWSLADLGRLADHWHVPLGALVTGPSETLDAMPPERVDELRAARNLPPLARQAAHVA
jgi:hypothetical protein